MNGSVGVNSVALYLPYFPQNIGSVLQSTTLTLNLLSVLSQKKKKKREKRKLFLLISSTDTAQA